MMLVVNTMSEGVEYSITFEEQAHLWLEDPQEFLQRFLTFGGAPIPTEKDTWPEEPLPEGAPSLQHFQEEVWGGCLGKRRVPGEVLAAGCDLLLSPD